MSAPAHRAQGAGQNGRVADGVLEQSELVIRVAANRLELRVCGRVLRLVVPIPSQADNFIVFDDHCTDRQVTVLITSKRLFECVANVCPRAP